MNYAKRSKEKKKAETRPKLGISTDSGPPGEAQRTTGRSWAREGPAQDRPDPAPIGAVAGRLGPRFLRRAMPKMLRGKSTWNRLSFAPKPTKSSPSFVYK